MNLAWLLLFVLAPIVCFLAAFFIGRAGYQETQKERYTVLSYFPYELYGDSRGAYTLPARIAECLGFAALLALPIDLVTVYSPYGGTSSSFAIGILLFGGCLVFALLFLSFIPLSNVKVHLGLYFASSLLEVLYLSMLSLLLISFANEMSKISRYSLAIGLFVLAFATLILWFNPKLSHFAEMDKVVGADGTISLKRPKPFVLAASEWLDVLFLLLGNLLAAVGFYLA